MGSSSQSSPRQYQTTHPWITFTADYRTLNYRTWILLGEAQSKCDHIAGVPLLPTVAEALHQIYLAKGVLATTAIEGNTLTEAQVLRRMRGELKLPPSKEYLGQEVDNVLSAYNVIGKRVLSGQADTLTVDDIREYNRLVLRSLPLEEGVVAGQIRDYAVRVGRYSGAPAEDCEFLLQRFCDWMNHEVTVTNTENRRLFGILKAVLAHVYFAWIHPFGDGNGRTARLLELQILLSSGVPSAAAHLLSNHYNQTRAEYYRQLDATSRSGGGLDQFVQYAVQGFVDGLAEQIEMIRAQQLVVHWRDYVYAQFRDSDSETERRRRTLVLDLTGAGRAITASEVRSLSPRLAVAYAGRTDKTIQRDLNRLTEMGLIRRTEDGAVANVELMLAFLPAARHEDT